MAAVGWQEAVGVIGLGQMGGGMARFLSGQVATFGYDVRPEAREALSRAGGRSCSSLEELAAASRVWVSSLPDGAAVRTACLGPRGLESLGRPGDILVELSTISPDEIREVAARLEARGMAVVDGSVTGGPEEAATGRMTVLAAGEPGLLGRVRPLLELLGEHVHLLGAVGEAKAVKLVNNVMSLGNVLVAAEAFTLGLKAGVPAERLYAILSTAGGRSDHFVRRFPRAIRGDLAPGFALALGVKDLRLALDFARQAGSPLPATAVMEELYAMACRAGRGEQDFVAILAQYREWAGMAPQADREA
ncbi:NAD(P)-dependent oxidoreductase [Limnochorda pilosa]|uniref:3-hydroxyisobutyrate dehydrogenase n=1 Tax=Limnochorda pilosa TaxID=1555112 RepID=A0A0K2SPJ2_LIMPI|nr:NAD(P)-dependent oxidoreductase [Limnochorda pilosa]BAS29040.1 3-hydroxyisobutyrate dehydrogenase [Limnochorda pilosa]